MRKLFVLFMLMLGWTIIHAQELNCMINVITPRIQSSDKKIYTTLQTSIYEFINNTKWTSDKFLPEERIECSMQIEVTDRPSTDVFKGIIQINARRPVYGTSYYSPLINFRDEDFNFRYVEFQTIEFNESGNNSNLAAMLAYYVYIILGYDYDSFSMMGGSQYFGKAQSIVANNANSSEKGWKAFESVRNRYWLTENLNNPIYKPIRKFYYTEHRKALDVMSKNRDVAIREIGAALETLRPVNSDKPQSLLMKTLFDAKSDEMVNIFSGAPNDVKSQAQETLNLIDPTNAGKYQKITQGKN